MSTSILSNVSASSTPSSSPSLPSPQSSSGNLSRWLEQADLAAPEAKTAQNYMQIKGLGNTNPMGCIRVDETCTYFYYHLADHTIVELEVILDPDEQRFSRKVTAFVTRPDEVDQLLAS